MKGYGEFCPVAKTAEVFARGIRRHDTSRRVWWLVLRPDEDVDVCVKYPGLAEDVTVRADLGAFTRTWLGYVGMREAVASGDVAIEGTREAVAAFARGVGLAPEATTRTLRYVPLSA